jgi:hypothetical protein
MSGLRRFLEPVPDRPPTPAEARCELCDAEIPEAHGHVVDIEARSLRCTCRACYLLFTHKGAARGRYRSVPDRCLYDPKFAISDAAWDELEIPVGVAFFFRSSSTGRFAAFYPSPAGATESMLPLDTWAGVLAANPAFDDIEPDVEALLIRKNEDGFGCFLVPIDACYDLVGRVRLHWHGLDGGTEAREAIDDFFAMLEKRSRLS